MTRGARGSAGILAAAPLPPLIALIAVGLLTATASGCLRQVEGRPPGYRAAGAVLSPAVPVPTPDTRSRVLLDPQMADVDEALDIALTETDGFARSLPDNTPPGFVAELERLFVAVGRLDDLLDAYLARVETDGPSSPFAPRLAVFYSELGYRAEARALLDAARGARGQGGTPADLAVAEAVWTFGASGADRQGREARETRIIGSGFLLDAVNAEPAFEGILVYGPEWPQRTLDRLPRAERAAAEGDLRPLAREALGNALHAGREAVQTDGD